MKTFTTNLSKIKGSRKNHSGVVHWLHQRFSAICIALMTFWLICFIKSIAYKDALNFISIVQKPWNLIALTFTVVIGLYHGIIGMRVILEDYISCICIRNAIVTLLYIFYLVTIIAFIFALFYMMTI
ncbi:MAG: succinate dehydrogenase, hydrophobic membrane anchor protein [Rickettsiaceae bacterium]